MQVIESLSNDALFSKDYYPWVGGSTLGQYFVSTTSSHYVWAIDKIKVNQKAKTSQSIVMFYFYQPIQIIDFTDIIESKNRGGF
jgi:hypothetical protein